MKKHISIWYLIGLQLAIYGFLIAAISIYSVFVPPTQHTVLEELHPGIYWGLVMFALGVFYTVKFRPK